MIAIRMLDDIHGWALTSSSILKTSDGGLHWTDVTPPNSPVHLETGTFMNQNIAWVVGTTNTPTGQGLFTVQRTSDGGTHWQRSQFSDDDNTGFVSDAPHFINRREGWLIVQKDFYPMTSRSSTDDVFHTTDGGSHWSKLATDEQIHQNASVYGRDTGISAKDRLNIWDTIDPVPSAATGTIPTNPVAFVTHDGAKT